ncbi:hypothetical protein [Microbacterium dextranolyticum]|uniref:Uncharacterized protein n=1 Tax=Microbacterium dextranolyticum TaxID=36806 RepID=A0A9W6HPU8_9MICO|nr:hypothetical protein [Microbacterium dextranolyticum]MBM7462466.1 hypothetical protein [Microbacterium dextranolyticum]GLJ96701.1 hypothetical protein GCM10017591_27640 [Microbacterium dextranolyticum]
MNAADADMLIPVVVAGVVLLALLTSLVLLLVARRRLRTGLILTATAPIVVCLVGAAVLPWRVPPLAGAALALLGVALAAVGGDPIARWVLRAADGGRTPDGPRGGILVELMSETPADAPRQEEILRGGTTIGYLERIATALAIIAGFPAAIAVVVALKGVGRFTELATPAARERFIVGTLASLLWASAVAGSVALLIV